MTDVDPRVEVVCRALEHHWYGEGGSSLDPVHLMDAMVAVTALDAYDKTHHVDASPSIDATHLAHQREWSRQTFGPGARLLGILDHIHKELLEIEGDPSDLGEWVDVIILAFDGAWRAGWEPQQIIDAVKAKQARNEARAWPDWRGRSEDQAIEHDRALDGTAP